MHLLYQLMSQQEKCAHIIFYFDTFLIVPIPRIQVIFEILKSSCGQVHLYTLLKLMNTYLKDKYYKYYSLYFIFKRDT